MPERRGVLGVFAHLDDAVRAIEAARAEGFVPRAFAPTPRHELEEALGEPESGVRVFTLAGALTGTAAGTALAVWTSLNWPLIVGGKEIVAMPAYSVIMFETTILIGALVTVVGLLALARLPRLLPVTKVPPHPRLTEDRFGVFLPAGEAERERAIALLRAHGAEEVIADA